MRQTLGTGMMAPLSMADNFVGNYYAGPSGAAMGALSAANSIAEGLVNMRARQDNNAELARSQAERDRARMDELNQRQAVAQAINPLQAAESSGMGNRDMMRRSMLPDAGTQMSLYNVAEAKRKEAEAADLQKKAAFATAWAAKGGYRTDPTGEKFMAQVGYNPFEYEGVSNIIAKAEEKEAQRQWQEQMKREGYTQAQILAQIAAAGRNEGKSYKPELFVNQQGDAAWVNPGEPVPQGYFPHSGNMGVTVNSDGTTTINAGGALKPIPTSAVASLTGNFGTLSKIDNALVANDAAPGATGSWKGMLNDVAPSLLNKIYSDEGEMLARATTADLGSMIIHDRSGAAVTLSEYPRLRPFIPTMYDSDEEKKTKLRQLRAAIAEETRLYADNFSPEMGYKRPESWSKYLDVQPMEGVGATGRQSGGGGSGNDLPEGFKELP